MSVSDTLPKKAYTTYIHIYVFFINKIWLIL